MSTSMRTPLKSVRRLGSAKEGADHFWMQRVTAVANLGLALTLAAILFNVFGKDYATVKSALSAPLVSLLVALFVISSVIHMRLGMQVIIEDYIHSEGTKIILLMLNTFFAIFIAAASLWAVLKLSFGA